MHYFTTNFVCTLTATKKLILSLFFALGCYTPTIGQEFSYRHYDIKDGLVGNHVYHMVQDKDGFLWFATETGVSRFDGSHFKNFTTEDGLPDNEIVRLFVDSKGRVWMAPFRNSVCYYYKGKIYNEKSDTILRNMKMQHPARQIMEDSAHNILIVDERRVCVIPVKGGHHWIDRYLTGDLGISTAGIDKSGKPYIIARIYANKQYSTACLEVKTDGVPRLVMHQIQGFEQLPGSVEMRYAFFTPDGLVFPLEDYVGMKPPSGLQYWGSSDNRRDTIDLPAGLNVMANGPNGQLYFNTFAGVKVYDLKAKKFTANLLESENVSYCMDDNEGNKWFATLGKGVYMASPDVKRVKLSDAKEYITAINGDKNLLFAGANADNRIYKIDLATGNCLANRYLPWLKDGKIVDIDKMDNHFYFLSTRGFYRSDTAFNGFESSSINSEGYTFKDMALVSADSFAFAIHSYTFTQSFIGLPRQIFNKRSTAVCHAFGGLFIGTLDGLYFLGPAGQNQFLGESETFLATRITKLLFANNRLWVGTNAYGVVCFDGKKVIKKVAEKEGLTGNIVRALYANGNDLWVGTDRGLNKLNTADSSLPIVSRYSSANGLASDMINAVYVADNMVYVGTPDGLSFFDETKAAQKSRCDLRLLAITVSGTNRPFTGEALLLNNRESNIRFEFVAISYMSAGDITYSYKLVGIDDEWKTTRDNFLLYPALPSGSYELRLMAINKFGVKSEELIIPFTIGKKLFEKNWFRVALVLLAIGLAWALTSWRIRRIRKRYREKIETNTRIATLEQQALKAQMNPHFIFNCLNSIQQYVIDKDVLGANKFITGFSRLIRQTLENSSKQLISVGEEEAFLNAYLSLEKLRFEGRFEYQVQVDGQISKEEVFLPPMLLQPYVENSIRHGIRLMQNGGGLVNINISLAFNRLICTVVDNGVGREAAQQYKSKQHIEYQSKGMLLTSQRVALFNKNAKEQIILQVEDMRDSDGKPSGTKITLSIPI
jgi:Histidine kinase/Y_Y_Y domain/Two component regulator propeller